MSAAAMMLCRGLWDGDLLGDLGELAAGPDAGWAARSDMMMMTCGGTGDSGSEYGKMGGLGFVLF